jgi:hypothetical protein
MNAADADWDSLKRAMAQHEHAEQKPARAAPAVAVSSATLPQRISPGVLTTRSLKVTCVVDPASVAALQAPAGQSHVQTTLDVGGRRFQVRFNAKSVRRVQHGLSVSAPETLVVMVQGRLGVGDVIEDAGITAQVKASKPAQAVEAAVPGDGDRG